MNQITPVRPIEPSARKETANSPISPTQVKSEMTVVSPESIVTVTKDAPVDPESPSISRRLSSITAEPDLEDSSQSDPTPILSQSPPEQRAGPASTDANKDKLASALETLTLSQGVPSGSATSEAVKSASAEQAAPHKPTLGAAFDPVSPAVRPPVSRSNASIPNSPEASSRPPSRLHNNGPSRIASPPSRDHAPLFAPSTFGRPPSVASNHSYARAPFATGKAAPAMAVTTSNTGNRAGIVAGTSDVSADELNPFMETVRTRRKSSSQSLIQREEFFRPGPSPAQSTGNSPNTSGFQSIKGASSPIFMQSTGDSGHSGLGVGAGSQGAHAATPSPGTSPGASASRLIRGFSLRKRTPSGLMDPPPPPPKPSAVDILRRFDGSGPG